MNPQVTTTDGFMWVTTDSNTGTASTSIGFTTTTATWRPWGETAFEYNRDGQQFSFGEKIKDDNYIKVDQGTPTKARYAIFYAVKTDPVIFCRTRRDMIKAIKRLLKRPEVDKKSIRIFALIGGAKNGITR